MSQPAQGTPTLGSFLAKYSDRWLSMTSSIPRNFVPVGRNTCRVLLVPEASGYKIENWPEGARRCSTDGLEDLALPHGIRYNAAPPQPAVPARPRAAWNTPPDVSTLEATHHRATKALASVASAK